MWQSNEATTSLLEPVMSTLCRAGSLNSLNKDWVVHILSHLPIDDLSTFAMCRLHTQSLRYFQGTLPNMASAWLLWSGASVRLSLLLLQEHQQANKTFTKYKQNLLLLHYVSTLCGTRLKVLQYVLASPPSGYSSAVTTKFSRPDTI